MSEPLTLESLAKRVAELEAKLAKPAAQDWTKVAGIMGNSEVVRDVNESIRKARQDEWNRIAREDAEIEAQVRAARGDAA